MLSIESVIYIIQYCLNESLQDCSFEQGSYLKWTVNELLDRLRENPEVTPLIIIKDFRNQMEEYSKVSPLTASININENRRKYYAIRNFCRIKTCSENA